MFPRFLLCPLSPQCQSSISRDVTYITSACLISLEECVSEGGGGSTFISWSRPTSVSRLLRSSLSSSSRSEEDTDTLINFRVQSQVYVEATGCVTCFSCLSSSCVGAFGHDGNFTSLRRIPRGHLFDESYESCGYESSGENLNCRRSH